jgi:hypothetical protein
LTWAKVKIRGDDAAWLNTPRSSLLERSMVGSGDLECATKTHAGTETHAEVCVQALISRRAGLLSSGLLNRVAAVRAGRGPWCAAHPSIFKPIFMK